MIICRYCLYARAYLLTAYIEHSNYFRIDILFIDEKLNLYSTEQYVPLVRNLSDLAVSSGSKLFEPFYLLC